MSGLPPGTTRRPDGAALVIAAILAALGGLLIREGARIPNMGGYSGVGPAGMPKLVGWCLLGLAGWTVADALRQRFQARETIEILPVLWIIGGLALQIGLLKTAGFSVASGLLFACTASAFGKRNMALTLPVGIVFALLVYAMFDQLLKLNLPAGPIETLLFGG